MTKVAARYKVSSSYLARVCQRMNIPRPARGHWAKLSAGKPSPQIPLPEPKPEDELTWSKEGDQPAKPWPQRAKPRKRPQRIRQDKKGGRHGLIVGASKHFDKVRKTDHGYLRPYKRLMVDVYVTRRMVERVLRAAGALFTEFEAHGHPVGLAPRDQRLIPHGIDERENARHTYHPSPWRPDRPTIVSVDGVAYGLTLFELSESVEVGYVGSGRYVPVAEAKQLGSRIQWTTHQDRPTGRLCLQVYSPYPETQWTQQWREKLPGDLESRTGAIIRTLRKEAPTIIGLADKARQAAEERERQWVALKQNWDEERIERQRAQALKESTDELLSAIETWAEERRRQAFFAEVEACAHELPEPERSRLLDRIRRGRELTGGIDPVRVLLGWKAPDERAPEEAR